MANNNDVRRDTILVVDAGVNDDVVCRLELALPPGALAKEKEHEDSA